MHIELRGREYVIKETLPNGQLRLLDIAFDESHSESEEDLCKALFAGELEFLGNSLVTEVKRKQAKRFVEDFNMLDDEDSRKIAARRRWAYVKAVVDAELDRYSEATVDPILQTIHRDIGDKKRKPHWRSVIYRYLPAWELSGRDNRSLLTASDKQGNRTSKYVGKGARKQKDDEYSATEKAKAKEVNHVIKTQITQAMKRGKRISVPELHEAIELAIVDENETEDSQDYLPVPTIRAVYDCVHRLPTYERDRLLRGKHYADKKFKSNGERAAYIRPLERVEFDDTQTNLLVVDPTTRLPLGMATETFGIDCYSGMPYGTHSGFDGTGYLPIARALLHGIQPKAYLKEKFPSVEGDWPVFGVPQEIGVDNGPGYISDDLTEACNQLGIVVDYCPVRDPDAKAYVESFFGRQNQKLLHKLDGTTFSNFLARADYDPEINAVISFDAYMEIKHLFLVDRLAREPNSSRHNIPINLWRLGVQNYPPHYPRCARDLRVLLGKVEVRVISNSGIAFECLAYNSEQLQFLRRILGGQPVKFKYDPVDISVIFVYDPTKDVYITVPALDQEYAKGLSLWQHQVIKRYTREELNQTVEAATILGAKKKIQSIVDQEWVKTGKSDTKRRLARYMGIRQPDYNSVLELRHEGQQEADGPVVDTEAQSAPGKIPHIMDPDSVFEGTSDFDEHIASQASPDPQTNLTGELVGTMEVNTTSQANKNNKKSAKTDAAVDRSHKASEAVNAPTADEWNDDDVDTAGFDVSFNLPKEKAHESDTVSSASNS
jgi:putative transposase